MSGFHAAATFAGVPALGMHLVAQAIPNPETANVLNAGATAVLGFLAFWAICRTIPQIVKDHASALKELAAKQDAWEKIRHEDHEHLQDSLRACAAVQDRLHDAPRKR
jgi:ABC-type nickel/cobalt efflux system permease component RcnA